MHRWKLWILVLFICLYQGIEGCIHPTGPEYTTNSKKLKNIRQPKPLKGYSPAAALPITSVGENLQIRLSRSGSKIIYVSHKRPNHKHGQIYQLIVATGKEQRLSYHDGNDFTPNYHPNSQKILYSSETDEIKENPMFIRQALEKRKQAVVISELTEKQKPHLDDNTSGTVYNFLKPINHSSEIYMADAGGNAISRVTYRPGGELNPQLSPKGSFIYFTSFINNQFDIFRSNVFGKYKKTIISHPLNDINPSLSNNGLNLVWTRLSKNQKTSKILLARQTGLQAKSIVPYEGLHLLPSWSADGKYIIFSSNLTFMARKIKKQTQNFELFLFRLQDSCLQRLTFSQGADLWPQLSPNLDTVYFVSDRSGSMQIYKMPFSPPEFCYKPKAENKPQLEAKTEVGE